MEILIFIGVLILISLGESYSSRHKSGRTSSTSKGGSREKLDAISLQRKIDLDRQLKKLRQQASKTESLSNAAKQEAKDILNSQLHHSESTHNAVSDFERRFRALQENKNRSPAKSRKKTPLKPQLNEGRKQPLDLTSRPGNIDVRIDDDTFMSTTMLAKAAGLIGSDLIEHFIRSGLLERDGRDKLVLTERGRSVGGRYKRKSVTEFWPVWPKHFAKSPYVIYCKNGMDSAKPINSGTALSSKVNGKILHYGAYHPYHYGNNPNFDDFSSLILDFKKGDSDAITYFFHRLIAKVDFDKTDAIVYVPSHDSRKTHSSVSELAVLLADHFDWTDATDCLTRIKTIQKLAGGGDRDKSVHLNSLSVEYTYKIRSKNVLVLDDVTTTGNSLKASMDLIKRNGARSVWAFALAETQH